MTRVPSGAARPMLPTWPSGHRPRPALSARNLRAMSILAQAVRSPLGIRLRTADLDRLEARLTAFRLAHRRKFGESPLDALAFSRVAGPDGPELWIAHASILVPSVPPAEPAEPAEPASL